MFNSTGLFAGLPDARSTIEADGGPGHASEAPYRPPALDSFAAAMMGAQGVERQGESDVAGFPHEPFQSDATSDFAAALDQSTQTDSQPEIEPQPHHIEDFASSLTQAPEARDIFSAQTLKDEQEVLITRAMLEAYMAELKQAVDQARTAQGDQNAHETEAKAAAEKIVKPGIYHLAFFQELIRGVLASTATTWLGKPESAETWTTAFNHKRKRKDENSFAAAAG